jgi:probable HAF family extracellular repeat protein
MCGLRPAENYCRPFTLLRWTLDLQIEPIADLSIGPSRPARASILEKLTQRPAQIPLRRRVASHEEVIVFLMHWLFGKTGKRNRVRPRARLFVEMLEARDVPSTYSIVDLGTLGGANSYASAINASGMVVGQAQTAAHTTDAFLWANGVMTDLGAPSDGSGQATAINAAGQVVGAFTVQQGEAGSESGFLYDNGTFSDLGTSVYPRGINDLGQIVGGYSTPIGVQHAFVSDNGQVTDLGTLGGAISTAYAINNAGQVVGSSQFSSSSPYFHAFLWQNGTMTDLGQLGTALGETYAYAVNSSGEVVGISGNSAFLYDSTGMHDLNVPTVTSAAAYAINDEGTIVGQSSTYAFIDQNGVVSDLNTLIPSGTGWQLTDATGINNAGQIVGTGWINGVQQAFLLNPVPTAPSPTAIGLFETTDPTFAPAIPVANDTAAQELGVQFTVSVPGSVSAIQFYRGAASTSGFTVHLWDANGNLLATGQEAGNQAAGWQTVDLDQTVELQPGVTYTASYYMSDGGYADTQNYTFQPRGPLNATQGVFLYGTSGGFPTQTYLNSNYWVSPIFQPDPSVGAAPVVTSLSASSSPTTGGTVLTINGSNFASSTLDIYFGDSQSLNWTLVNNNTLAALIPAHPAGTVDVRVITAAGESAISSADQFTYVFNNTLSPTAIPLFETTDPTFAPAIPVANDTAAQELGVQFTVSVPGTVSAIQFYRGAASSSGFTVHLWDANGNLLATGQEAGNQAPGWQTVSLDESVELQPGVTYTASYYTSDGGYADTQNYTFQSRGPLTALQGVFLYGSGGGFPTQTYLSSNYWVGPIFEPDASVGTPPVVTSLSESTSPTGGGTVLTITGSNFTSSTVAIYFGDSPSLNFTVVNDNTLAALIPAHPAGTVDVRVITAAGESAISSTDQFTYTPTSPDLTTALTLFETDDPTFSPAIPVANDNSPVEVGVKFTVFVPGSVSAIQFYRGAPSGSGFTVHLWDANGNLLATGQAPANQAAGWQTAALDQTVELQPDATYIASYYSPDGGYAVDTNYFTNNGISRGSLLAFSAAVPSEGGTAIPNGVYVYGVGGGFPTQSYLNSNYWVTPVFQPDPSVGPAPVVTSLSVTSAPASGGGGLILTINGSNFTPDAIAPSVYFGDTQAQIHIFSPTQIFVFIPAHPASTVDVRVVTDAGESAITTDDLFTFTG